MPKGQFTRKYKLNRKCKPIEYVIGPSIAYVPLTRGLFSLIDAEDGPRVGQHNWCSSGSYAWRNDYRTGMQSLHCFIFGPTEHTVDHINRTAKLDNRKSNLREATYSQQMANKGMQNNNTSGHPGVRQRWGRWHSQITFNSKAIHLGTFATYEEACSRYREEHRRLFGDFSIFRYAN